MIIKPINMVYTDSRTEALYQKCVNRIVWGNDYGFPEYLGELLNTGTTDEEVENIEYSQSNSDRSFAYIRPKKVSFINLDVTKLP